MNYYALALLFLREDEWGTSLCWFVTSIFYRSNAETELSFCFCDINANHSYTNSKSNYSSPETYSWQPYSLFLLFFFFLPVPFFLLNLMLLPLRGGGWECSNLLLLICPCAFTHVWWYWCADADRYPWRRCIVHVRHGNINTMSIIIYAHACACVRVCVRLHTSKWTLCGI